MFDHLILQCIYERITDRQTQKNMRLAFDYSFEDTHLSRINAIQKPTVHPDCVEIIFNITPTKQMIIRKNEYVLNLLYDIIVTSTDPDVDGFFLEDPIYPELESERLGEQAKLNMRPRTSVEQYNITGYQCECECSLNGVHVYPDFAVIREDDTYGNISTHFRKGYSVRFPKLWESLFTYGKDEGYKHWFPDAKLTEIGTMSTKRHVPADIVRGQGF